ncbi:tetraspanin-33-like [Pelodytes ibericus]
MRTSQIAKYCLFVSCYVFWVASGMMIAVGMYATLSSEERVVDTLITDPSLILMAVGILMFAITFVGCMGALRDIHLLLKIFAWLLLIVLILQFVAAILGFMFSGMVLEKAASVMSTAITRYREDLDLQNFIDYIQKKFECCGVNTYTDWSLNIYFYCADNNPSLESCGVPYSCCIKEKGKNVINTMCGYETQNLKRWDAEDRIYVDGCLNKIVSWGRGNLLFLGGMATGLIFLEIFVICLAVVLVYEINVIMERRKSTAPVSSVKRKSQRKEEFMTEREGMNEVFLEQEYMETYREEEIFVEALDYTATIECEFSDHTQEASFVLNAAIKIGAIAEFFRAISAIFGFPGIFVSEGIQESNNGHQARPWGGLSDRTILTKLSFTPSVPMQIRFSIKFQHHHSFPVFWFHQSHTSPWLLLSWAKPLILNSCGEHLCSGPRIWVTPSDNQSSASWVPNPVPCSA